MVIRIAALIALAACAAPAPVQTRATPLATEAQIVAAEAAALSDDWLEWNTPIEPFNVIGNIYYVGAEGISAYLITTPDGHILEPSRKPRRRSSPMSRGSAFTCATCAFC